MRIIDPRIEFEGGTARLAAEVVWEGSDSRMGTVYFAREESDPSELECALEPFVVATMPCAARGGQARLWVDGSVCPWLADGLRAAASFLGRHSAGGTIPDIQPRAGFRPPPPIGSKTTSFLSGGLDALALLRANLRTYPANHPRRIGECILVFGLSRHDFDDGRPVAARVDHFRRYRDAAREVLQAIGVVLTTVHTNVRSLYSDESWWSGGFSAGLIGAGMGTTPACTDLLMGSDGLGFHTDPLSMNAYLAHCYSTSRTRTSQAQVAWTRLEKLRLVADWPDGMRILRPCAEHSLDPDGFPNCGHCSKCLRTKVGLLAVGADLSEAPTFKADDVTVEDVAAFEVTYWAERAYTAECVEPLRQMGRGDLAEVLLDRIAAHDARVRRDSAIWRKAWARLR